MPTDQRATCPYRAGAGVVAYMDESVAVLPSRDQRPKTLGHMLVVTRLHFETLHEMPPSTRPGASVDHSQKSLTSGLAPTAAARRELRMARGGVGLDRIAASVTNFEAKYGPRRGTGVHQWRNP
jgi:hypothetical protein